MAILLLRGANANADAAESLHHHDARHVVIGNSSAETPSDEFIITSISPESGPTSGGTDMQLMGSGSIDSILDGDELQCVFESNGPDALCTNNLVQS